MCYSLRNNYNHLATRSTGASYAARRGHMMADTTRSLRFVSWNVNGLRAVLKKEPSFTQIFDTLGADVFALQETKLQEGQVELDLPGYHQYWSYAERKGYSGTAVFTREEPLQVVRTIGSLWFVDVYTPNSKNGLARLDERMEWDARYRDFLTELAQDKPVVTCGDFNVAHEEIDLARPDDNHESAGFSDEERESFTKLLESGLVDTFRERHPDLAGAYSWWSYRMRARERGIGWRIDYFLVSPQLMPKVTGTAILDDVYGSDHCPIELELEL